MPIYVGANQVASGLVTFAQIVVTDSTGSYVAIDSLPKTYGRDGSGNVMTVTATDGTNTWVKTYTRDGSGNVTAESRWVKS